MTEAEWQACTNPNELLFFLEGQASERKLRLFALACCQRVGDLITDARSRKAIETAQRYVEGLAGPDELAAAHQAAREAWNEVEETQPDGPAAGAAAIASGSWKPHKANNFSALVRPFLANPHSMADISRHKAAVMAEWAAQADLLRDIFGNPFRPASFDSAWRTPRVVSLAESIYEERAFDRMPLLADALEEVGCTNADIWVHCEEPASHVRGCWVVDLILRKA